MKVYFKWLQLKTCGVLCDSHTYQQYLIYISNGETFEWVRIPYRKKVFIGILNFNFVNYKISKILSMMAYKTSVQDLKFINI